MFTVAGGPKLEMSSSCLVSEPSSSEFMFSAVTANFE